MPPGNNVVELVTLPLPATVVRVKPSTALPVFELEMSDTSPVGVPVAGEAAATVIFTGTAVPWVTFTGLLLFNESVVVLPFTMAVFH